jgi:cell wall-associated NlpC family hydrolase
LQQALQADRATPHTQPERTVPDSLVGDHRLSPLRDGLAVDLSKSTRMQVIAGASALRKATEAAAEQVNQALFGEGVSVFAEREGWAWVQLDADHYSGWIRADELGPRLDASHRVRVLRTFIFEQSNMKSAPLRAVSMNARLSLGDVEAGFSRVLGAGGGWVFSKHAAVAGDFEKDFVEVATRFVGSPYLWGGRESAGIDCSGLVQIALQATGVSPLRDSDMQEQTLGVAVEPAKDFSNLRRGDLVFWRGHVGIMESPAMLIHASARDLHVEIEPFAEAVARIRPIAGDVRSVRRL